MNILITGASGFLGSAVLARIGAAGHYDAIYLLMRPSGRKSPTERALELVNKIFPPEQAPEVMKRVRAVSGDLTSPHLGLGVRDRWEILDRVHQILHVGASTDFGAPLDVSRLHNVEGTRKVLELADACARQGVLERLDYVSTAFVAGTKRGIVRETDLDRGQTFANNYERSKFEAELLVRTYQDRFPVAIHRPSIVVGDSETGFTPHFKVLYWPLRLLAKGLLTFFPCNLKARMDVVPVDYVADAIVAVMTDPGTVQKTFHITAGSGREIRVGDLLRQADAHAGIRRVPTVPFLLFNLFRKSPLRKLMGDDFWRAVDLAAPYKCYLEGTGVRFDAGASQEWLSARGVIAPKWDDYGFRVLGFCAESRWGRKLSKPEYAYYLPGRRAGG